MATLGLASFAALAAGEPSTAANAAQVDFADEPHDRVHADVSADAFVSWARTRPIALQNFPSDAGSASALGTVIGAARVVALGEPAHGAHEPLAFRNRLAKHLVEKRGFTAIALESGLSEARRVNEFVLGGSGDVREIAREGLTWGFGSYAENIALLRWLRQYNTDAAHLRKVRFYGIDLPGGSDGDFSTARGALDAAISYLVRADPDASQHVRVAIEPFLERFTHGTYERLRRDQRQQLRGALDDMLTHFERERRRLIASSSAEDYEWAQRSAVAASQLEELFRLWPTGSRGESVSPGFHRAAAARDAAMADNVQWVLRREGPAGRVLVFAHNAHIMNAPLRGGIWSVYPQPPTVMGQHLRAALGEDLVIIGASSAKNGKGLPPAAAAAGSVDEALGRVGIPQFLLDLRDARNSPAVSSWLDRLQPMRANFTTELVLPPRDAFDAVVFIDELSPAGSVEP